MPLYQAIRINDSNALRPKKDLRKALGMNRAAHDFIGAIAGRRARDFRAQMAAGVPARLLF